MVCLKIWVIIANIKGEWCLKMSHFLSLLSNSMLKRKFAHCYDDIVVCIVLTECHGANT